VRDAVGILLAGGAGLRLGAAGPKAIAVLGEESLLARAVRTLERTCRTNVLAPGARLDLPDPGWPRVRDAYGAACPLGGIVAGLAHAAERPALVLAVDFPLVRPATLEALLDRLEAPWDAVVPAPAGRLQPVCAAYAPAARPKLDARLLAGERSITAALAALEVLRLDDAALAALGMEPHELLNVNRPAEMEEAARHLRADASRAT
jgi:molybdopterin-guanine dinucleotide biosynthesis protein A